MGILMECVELFLYPIYNIELDQIVTDGMTYLAVKDMDERKVPDYVLSDYSSIVLKFFIIGFMIFFI